MEHTVNALRFGSHCSRSPLSHRWASRWSPCSRSHAHRGGGLFVITPGTSLWVSGLLVGTACCLHHILLWPAVAGLSGASMPPAGSCGGAGSTSAPSCAWCFWGHGPGTPGQLTIPLFPESHFPDSVFGDFPALHFQTFRVVMSPLLVPVCFQDGNTIVLKVG